MTVDQRRRRDTSTRPTPFVEAVPVEECRKMSDSDTHVTLVLEINGINVQLFYFGVEGCTFHSQFIGCTRCTTYHSTRLSQGLKDELALDLWGHFARGWLCAIFQFVERNLQDR